MKLTKKYRTIKNKTKKGGTRSNKNQSNQSKRKVPKAPKVSNLPWP